MIAVDTIAITMSKIRATKVDFVLTDRAYMYFGRSFVFKKGGPSIIKSLISRVKQILTDFLTSIRVEG